MRKNSAFQNKSGIYMIKNLINNHIYIGSAVNLYNRETRHINKLESQKHENSYLQRAWNKYGEDSFIFIVLEYVSDIKDLIIIEQYYIDWLQPEYNICKSASSTLGRKFSEETKRKISESHKGKKLSEEHKNRIKQNRKDYHHSDSIKEKMSEFRMNKSFGSKLSSLSVKWIKYWKSCKISNVEIAKVFNVSDSHICKIIYNKTWKNVN